MGNRGALRVGVIGLGGVSRHFLHALSVVDDASLVAVCDVNPARTAAYASLPGVCAFESASELLEHAGIDAVVVDTPVGTHLGLCRMALEAGAHVCCEKPLALSSSDSRELLALAEARRLTLFTAFHRRYNRHLPDPRAAALDDLAAIEVRYLEKIEDHTNELGWYASPSASGGGCIVDNGPNAYDVVRHLVGEMTVTDVAVTRSSASVDMAAVVRGSVGSAVDATIFLDWAYDGECKEVLFRRTDGTEETFDMLEGFAAFKSSLDHEYIGIVNDFVDHVVEGRADPYGHSATLWLEAVLACSSTIEQVAS